MIKLKKILTGGFLLASFSGSYAGGAEVIVIFNTHVPASRSLAQYYAERRHVPQEQVFGLDLPASEDISRADFREYFQNALAKKLESLKLWQVGDGEMPGTNGKPVRVKGKIVSSNIRYAVLCYGVPLRIQPDATLKEPVEESTRPEFRRNGAAVDSELACLPLINQKVPLTGLLRNPVYTTTNAAWLNPTNGVLMVARLDGPTPEIARRLVDQALQAERDGLWGRSYFDLRSITDPGMKPGDDWIRNGAEVSRLLGYETIVDTNSDTFSESFPMSQIALYAGWYRESVSGPFTLPKVEFMPGAFAYHLHSFSAASLRTTDRNWVGPLLAKGATCTMGCVDEPYLGGTPDVGIFLSRWLYFGFTFGEAAYAAQPVLSWQTTVVGDPLYRPFVNNPQELHNDLERRHNPLLEWSHLRLVDFNLSRGANPVELVNYLETIPTTKASAVLTEKLGDLNAALGKPSSAVHAYQQALTRHPSPQQRIRLRLTLGEKLMALKREGEARENYEKLLEEAPDYTDAAAIRLKLAALVPSK